MKCIDLLKEKNILLSDGAWGTELAKKGVEPGGSPELLNVESADIIKEVASSYVEAGSDIILTNTFGGSPFKLAKYGLEERTEELNEVGAAISVEVASGKCLVAGSVGPTGEFMAPLGLTTETEMVEAFARQVRSFVKAGVDVIIAETMTDLGEITSVIKAVKDNSDLPVICSMTFDKGVKEYATMMGVTPQKAAEELEAAGADIVGSNCGSGIVNMIDVARLMRPATGLPLWFKPNAGMPELVDGKTVFRETPEEMGSRIYELIDAGASIVGGCCGSTPAHIRKFRELIDAL